MPPGSDPIQLGQLLHHAHNRFVASGSTDTGVRQVVADFVKKIVQGNPLDTDTVIGAQASNLLMLDHYQQTENLLVSYSENALGFF